MDDEVRGAGAGETGLTAPCIPPPAPHLSDHRRVSDPLIIDQFSPLSHKQLIGPAGETSTFAGRTLPSWVPAEDRRRLAAYIVRAAYLGNSARLVLPESTTPTDRAEHREYGDPSAVVGRLVSAVIGDDWGIAVDGADGDLLAGPQLPDRPEDPGPDADPLTTRIHQARLAAWERDAAATVDAWEAALEAQPVARERQRQLDQWAETAQLGARLKEAEDDAVGLADGVMVLWPQPGAWPKVSVHSPGFFFVEHDDDPTGEFPHAVHLCWEQDQVVAGAKRRLVRRLTWRLIPVDSAHVVTGPDGTPVWDGGDRPILAADEKIIDGRVVRVMPWHSDADDPATVTCWFTDATWDLADLLGRNEAHPDADPFTVRPLWETNPGEDLRCNFIPAIHLPNTPTGKELWGSSSIDNIAQVMDDIAEVDGLTMSAASYIGDPTAAVSGARVADDLVMMPGRVFGLGENGRMDVLDLAGGVEKLEGLGDRLQERAWTNAGIPMEVVGRGRADLSGIALALRLAPFAQMVGSMRMARAVKDRLVPRFAVKLAMLAGAIEPGPVGEARIVRGSFLPTDRAATVEMVSVALQAHAISTTTAVALLMGAGVAIDDAQAEVARIRAEWTAAAKDLADATGSEQLAADWLGVELPTPPTPVITLPEV